MTKKELRDLLEREFYSSPPPSNWFQRLYNYIFNRLFSPSANACLYIRKMQYHATQGGKNHSLLARFYHMKLVNNYGMCVAPTVKIGIGLQLPHPTGIVLGSATVIGENCSIYQNVTIGGANIGDAKAKRQPHIGDNCIFFSGAMALGNIEIEDYCVLGANSVLLSDAISKGIYVGSPAKIIKRMQ